MPRPPIQRKYIFRIEELAEREFRSPTITRLIATEAERDGIMEGWPGEKTVRRYYNRYMQSGPEERLDNRPFSWADRTDEARIPWEASPAIFEYLRYEAIHRKGPPSVGRVRWFWRVTAAAEDLDFGLRVIAAAMLAETQRSPTAESLAVRGAVEAYLIFAPWRWTNLADRELVGALLAASEVEALWPLETPEPLPLNHVVRFIELVLVERGAWPAGDPVPAWIAEARAAAAVGGD